MDAKSVKPGQCYRLIDGMIVRVVSINGDVARCDTYSDPGKKWIQMFAAVPASVLREPCENPQGVA
jgi:hypothetical protein